MRYRSATVADSHGLPCWLGLIKNSRQALAPAARDATAFRERHCQRLRRSCPRTRGGAMWFRRRASERRRSKPPYPTRPKRSALLNISSYANLKICWLARPAFGGFGSASAMSVSAPQPVTAAPASTPFEALFDQRIAILDGAMGSLIQTYGLTEQHFRGSQFA